MVVGNDGIEPALGQEMLHPLTVFDTFAVRDHPLAGQRGRQQFEVRFGIFDDKYPD
jgi:hypothetical protein